jgi:hypothetical protein
MGIYGYFMVISRDAMGFYDDLMGITVSVSFAELDTMCLLKFCLVIS